MLVEAGGCFSSSKGRWGASWLSEALAVRAFQTPMQVRGLCAPQAESLGAGTGTESPPAACQAENGQACCSLPPRGWTYHGRGPAS